jgi:hypothetical protein
MICKGCKKTMSFVYDVLERETVFVLWECACGHKELERKPGAHATPRPVAAMAVAAVADEADGEV